MRFLLFILLLSQSVFSQTINAPGKPASITINAPGKPSSITVNRVYPVDYGDTVFVFVLWGQSNVGRARESEMSGAEADLYSGLITNSKILNPYLSDTELYSLNVGTNTMLDDADNLDEFGCEASLLKTLQNEDPHPRYLLKYGDGNTSMQGFWSAAANRTGWLNLLTYTTNIANAIIAEGKIPVMKAVIMMQGESDAASESFANNWGWRMESCYDSFKTHWASILTANSLPAQEYKWVIGRVLDVAPFSDTIRTYIVNFCSDPENNAEWIDMDSYPMRDASHYSATGQIMFGLDIKNAIE